jgi:hypothetical protein
MNFARYKCDRRAAQSLMRYDAFSLQVGNEADASRVRNTANKIGVLFIVVARATGRANARPMTGCATKQSGIVDCGLLLSVVRCADDRIGMTVNPSRFTRTHRSGQATMRERGGSIAAGVNGVWSALIQSFDYRIRAPCGTTTSSRNIEMN